jgi:nucleoid-associated protein EbfC
MFGKLAEAQQKAAEMKNRLDGITVEGIAGNNEVTVLANCNKNIKAIHIEDSMMTLAKKEELEELLVVAIERAMHQAETVSSAEMKSLMGSMMPGMGGLFGK